jgi:exosortase
LIWQTLKDEKFEGDRDGSALGFLFLVPGLLLHVLDNLLWSQILSSISIVPTLVGLSFLLLGRSAARSILVPLLLLLLMIPIPMAFSQPIILLLRKSTAFGAEHVMMLLGYPIHRWETALELAAGTLIVDNACSGVTTLYATVTYTIIILHTWPPGPLRSIVCVALALPMTLLANVLRIVFLCLITVHYGVEILNTFIHPLSGYPAYFVAIGLQTVVLWVFRRRAG